MINEHCVLKDSKPAKAAGVLALLLAATAGMTASVSDWRQFREPNGSGIAPSDAQPATTWSDSQSVKWTVALPGPGSSSPIVAGERVFITCYSGYGGRHGGDPPEQRQPPAPWGGRTTGKS